MLMNDCEVGTSVEKTTGVEAPTALAQMASALWEAQAEAQKGP